MRRKVLLRHEKYYSGNTDRLNMPQNVLLQRVEMAPGNTIRIQDA